VVFLANPGVIDVTELVSVVEVDQERAIANRKVPRHGFTIAE
jgi:hypothetical protein